MEAVFSDASRHLEHYRSYLASACGLPAGSAAFLMPDSLARRHTLFLLLYREIVRCQNGDVDDASPDVQALSIATYGIFRSVAALDGLIDTDGGKREAHLALECLLHYEAAIRNLASAVGSDPGSARALRRLSRMCLSMYEQERKPPAQAPAGWLRILFRKSSLVLMPIAWARCVHGPSERHATLRCGLIKLFVAMQLIDDVHDHDEDVAAGQFTPYRAHAEHVLGTEHAGAARGAARRTEIECLHLAAARDRLRSAMDAFRRAGSEVLAQCVSLVHDEICRVLSLRHALLRDGQAA